MTNRCLTAVAAVGLLASGALAQEVQAYAMEGNRKMTGLFLWDGSASPGSFSIQYGTPGWKPEYQQLVASNKAGKMRLGKDAWTSLDTSLILKIGGKRVPRGQYYLGVERDDAGKFHLMVFRSRKILNTNRNPAETASLEADIRCPLKHTETEKEHAYLTIAVKANEKNAMRSQLAIRWGNHQLTAPIVAAKAPPPKQRKKKNAQVADAAARGIDTAVAMTPAQEVKVVVANMIKLIETKKIAKLLETYADPAMLKEQSFEEILARFDAEKQAKTVRLLKIALDVKPEIVDDGKKATLKHEAFPEPLMFKKIEGHWKVIN